MKTKKTYLIILALVISSYSYSQVGIGTIEPHGSSILDLESTSKGFLPPRMTDAQRDGIINPAAGLVIYNTIEKCLQFYNNNLWYSICSGLISPPATGGGDLSNGFENNTLCTNKLISISPCSSVNGATLNDDTDTIFGKEYDWTGATGFVAGGTTRALIEIEGQCWYRRNADNTPSSFDPSPDWVNNSDQGWSGYYAGVAFPNEGRLYQWSAAMNGEITERAQGVCAPGWHVPSDCEWMYLENSLGMSVEQQASSTWRSTTGEGTKLKSRVSSGFNVLMAGFRFSTGEFWNRIANSYFWTSTLAPNQESQRRLFSNPNVGVFRLPSTVNFGFSVRCIKD